MSLNIFNSAIVIVLVPLPFLLIILSFMKRYFTLTYNSKLKGKKEYVSAFSYDGMVVFHLFDGIPKVKDDIINNNDSLRSIHRPILVLQKICILSAILGGLLIVTIIVLVQIQG